MHAVTQQSSSTLASCRNHSKLHSIPSAESTLTSQKSPLCHLPPHWPLNAALDVTKRVASARNIRSNSTVATWTDDQAADGRTRPWYRSAELQLHPTQQSSCWCPMHWICCSTGHSHSSRISNLGPRKVRWLQLDSDCHLITSAHTVRTAGLFLASGMCLPPVW